MNTNAAAARRQNRQWTPVLDASLRDRAKEQIVPIADATTAFFAKQPTGMGSVASGTAGHALVLGYLWRCGFGDGYAETAREFMDQAIQGLPNLAHYPAFYGGYSGVAWAASRLRRMLGDPSEADDFAEIDVALHDVVSKQPWESDYDLVSGLVGFGIYLLERLPDPVAVEGLVAIVDRLAETAIRIDSGITWLSHSRLMIPETAAQFPKGYYNLGLAHGVPGVIAMLARLLQAGIAVDASRDLLMGAMSWQLANRLPDSSPSAFAYHVAADERPGQPDRRPCRLAWCYGDLGAAVALLSAAKALDRADWRKASHALVDKAARRQANNSGVIDAGICHGAAGNALLFSRIYHATGSQDALASARMWYGVCLGLRQPDKGIAGYPSWKPNKDQVNWADDPGLLSGSGGVCAALAAGVSDVEPDWDAFLLSDLEHMEKSP
jgi:lantibiotic biosynthesis protein